MMIVLSCETGANYGSLTIINPTLWTSLSSMTDGSLGGRPLHYRPAAAHDTSSQSLAIRPTLTRLVQHTHQLPVEMYRAPAHATYTTHATERQKKKKMHEKIQQMAVENENVKLKVDKIVPRKQIMKYL